METIYEIMLDALLDSIKALPFLFGAYLLLEYLEHRASDKMNHMMAGSRKLGPVAGALLGCIPQCGFSVAAANLYSGRIITAGALIAVFLSTSDEAIPVLLSEPQLYGTVLWLMVIKIVIALVAGILVDLLAAMRLKAHKKPLLAEEDQMQEICKDCDCEHSVLKSALHHTLEIFFFLFVVSLILGAVVEAVGQERLGALLLKGSIFQPALAALIGFIPNCAASVILTRLFIEGTVSFGALAAGLLTGAGAGLAVLWRVNLNVRDNLRIMAILYVVAVVTGSMMQLFSFVV